MVWHTRNCSAGGERRGGGKTKKGAAAAFDRWWEILAKTTEAERFSQNYLNDVRMRSNCAA
jgi:hypothetical protein